MELRILDAQIDARVQQTLEQHPDWPCRRGCDGCCRSLTHPPVLTKPEWERVHAALRSLSAEVRAAAEERIRSRWSRACPLLDSQSGACLVYEQRPVACRTYGFYADREAGLYCRQIEARVESGQFDDVMWGNQESVNSTLDEAGERRTLAEWLAAP